ncbi:12S rRNA N(4)-cytidine methyltransferase METTL15 [Lepeophtheirus salmonis]|uniref:12S rRNA N(4)-cytidine methyltransferase METTL15 n=1 Tax=Lepeophtheirus salmonis TaxID=72036 RepID=UPI001AEB6747|nr:12S rRNA N4-methylcytidine methyltransferase-like [Lepeophtheirus salmonis]
MAFNSKLKNLRKISKVIFPGAVCPIGNNVSHTPIFAREVLDILRPKGGQVFVDATHGTGGHTRLILDKQKHARVFAFDIDDNSIELGKKLGKLYKIDSLHASVSRFSDLSKHFIKLGINEHTLEGFLIDCGVSDLQLNDHSKGFSAKGPLDLRMDPQRLHYLKTGLEVLQTASHSELLSLLIDYGNLSEYAHLITDTILNTRFMFNHTFIAEKLYEILLDSVKFSKERKSLFLTIKQASKWEDKMTTFLLESIITALRIFINDEVNQLNIGIRTASHFLKPGGLLIVIVRNEVEENEFQRTLTELSLSNPNSSSSNVLKTYRMRRHVKKFELGITDQILHPRVNCAKMFVVSKA